MSNETKTAAIIQIKDIINKEDFKYIVEVITYVKFWLILFVIIITKIILIKIVKLCNKIYTVHNDKIIRQRIPGQQVRLKNQLTFIFIHRQEMKYTKITENWRSI